MDKELSVIIITLAVLQVNITSSFKDTCLLFSSARETTSFKIFCFLSLCDKSSEKEAKNSIVPISFGIIQI